jgi:hypothetical protein
MWSPSSRIATIQSEGRGPAWGLVNGSHLSFPSIFPKDVSFMDYEQKFNELYEYFEKQIEMGDLHGDNFDRVDSVLALIYGVEDQASGIFYSLETDEEKRVFLQDFKNAVEHLRDGKEDSDEKVAEWVMGDREK